MTDKEKIYMDVCDPADRECVSYALSDVTFTGYFCPGSTPKQYDVKVYSWGYERTHISPGNFDIVGSYQKCSAGACHEIWKANVKHGWVPVNEWLTDYSERMKPAEEMERIQ